MVGLARLKYVLLRFGSQFDGILYKTRTFSLTRNRTFFFSRKPSYESCPKFWSKPVNPLKPTR
ncbi:hypothetical protein Hanom_Chr11g01049921 [Helianthus anomalus]